MTLIVSYLTHDYVYQVSDRRLRDLAAGREAVETPNKAVDYCGLIVFASTGLAAINGMRSDLWLASALNQAEPRPFQEVAEIVRRSASNSFLDIRGALPTRERQHSFVGVGWGHPADGESQLPVICVISNCEDGNGNSINSPPFRFALEQVFLEPANPREAFAVHGGSSADKEKIRRQLRKHLGKKLGPEAVVATIAGAVRQVAEHNPLVGKDLLAVTFPRTALGSPFSLSSQALGETRTYELLPEGQRTGVSVAPQFVSEAGAMVDHHGTRPGLRQDVSYRFFRRGDPIRF